MPNVNTNPPPHLPRVYPKWKRTHQSTDIPPTRIRKETTTDSADANSLPSGDDDDEITTIHIGANNPSYSKLQASTCATKATVTGVCLGICPTCNKNEARYTCPRCFAPYCSIACYKIHDIPKQTGNPDSGGGRCTEAFYRDKVQQVSNLAVKDDGNVSQMRDILTRSHHYDCVDERGEGNNNKVKQCLDEDENTENGKIMPSTLTDEELVELAEYVLKLDDETQTNNTDPITTKTTSRPAIPIHLMHKFESAVQRGELSHLIEEEHHFHPYWMPQSREQMQNNKSLMFSSDALEERICSIQPLPLSSKKVNLQYNICEVLYVTAWTLRRYHMDVITCGERKRGRRRGHRRESVHTTDSTTEKESNDTVIDIISFMYVQSQVLSNDARYSSIEEMLMACTERTRLETIRRTGVTAFRNLRGKSDVGESFGNNVDREALLNDIVHMSKHRRMILRILIDANDMINDGSKALKRRQKVGHDIKHANNIQRSDLKLATKKMEYYMSWCHTYWDESGSEISEEIERWMNDWKYVDQTEVKEDGQHHDGDILHVMDKKSNDSEPPPHGFKLLPSEGRKVTDISLSKDESFLVPVSTRKLTTGIL